MSVLLSGARRTGGAIPPAQERAGGSHEPRSALWVGVDAPGGHLDSTPESETQHRVRDARWQDAWAVCRGVGDGVCDPDGVPRKRVGYPCPGAGERCRATQVIEAHASDHRPLFALLQR